MTPPLGASEPVESALPKLRSHGLHAPTVEDLRNAVWAGTLENVDTVWDSVCAEAGLSRTETRMTLAELEKACGVLTARGGPIGLVGRAMGARLAAYRAISVRGSDAPAPPFDWARNAMDTLLRGRVSSPDRVDELVSLDPFAAEVRTELDMVATRVAQRLGTTLGGVSVVLDGAQCLVGSSGGDGGWLAEAGGLPIEWSFCATTVRTAEPYVVPDASQDVLQRVNPTVLHDGAGSYAGAPLITSAGEVLGACCVIDHRPRCFTSEELEVLVEEARFVVAELERRRAKREERAAPA
jgi:hypothetical protein